MLDGLLRGGEIIDGSGAPGFMADVGIEGDRIAFVGDGSDVRAREVVELDGMLLTPGLIDPHSHSDWSILGNRDALSTIAQGVTTEVVGNCGVTHAPLSHRDREGAAAALQAFGYDGDIVWSSFGEYLEAVHGEGTAQNLVWFVGHTALHTAAEADVAETGVELASALETRLREALDAGAIGFTTGLEYGVGRFASSTELMGLARVLRDYDGMYASHIRNRDALLGDAVDEFFQIAREGAARCQLSHLNVRHDTGAAPDAWERAVERMMVERDRGIHVLADMTPYPDGIGLATGILPAWLLQDGAEKAARLLRDPSVRAEVREDSDRYWRFVHKGQWHRVRLAVSPATPELEGLTFPEIADRTGREPWDAFFDIMVAAGADMNAVQFIGHLFEEEHVSEAVQHSHFLLGVDGYTSRRDGVLGARTRHPLFFHGSLHFLAHHAVQSGHLTIEEAVRKMTGAVAEQFGIVRRGLVAPGMFADLVAYDREQLRKTDTFQMPEEYATAARHVWVNGERVIADGKSTSIRTGRFLPRQG